MASVIEHRANYCGPVAEEYEARRASQPQWQAEHAAVRELLAPLRGTAGTVLDIPVGTGRFMPIYQEFGLTPLGMDVSPDMLRIAGDRGFPVFPGDILSIPIVGKCLFRAAICVRLLNWLHADEVAQALSELARVTAGPIIAGIRLLRPGAAPPRRKIIVHSQDVFDVALAAAGLKVARAIEVNANDSTVYSMHELRHVD